MSRLFRSRAAPDDGEHIGKQREQRLSAVVSESEQKMALFASRGRDDCERLHIGLIVTELVINAIKYAFPAGHARSCIQIGFQADTPNWRLTVADNGVGIGNKGQSASGGLGTAIITALGKQLKARLSEVSGDGGFCVSITHGTLASDLPLAA